MKTIAFLVARSLRQHALSTAVTAASIALAAGLLMTVWIVKGGTESAFRAANGGYDAVLGARGSKLQLVLNAVFHLEASPGNLSADDYAQIRAHPAVARAVPLALGDNYYGWRIVGTLPEFFTGGEYAPGKTYTLARGGWFSGEEGKREAVIGALAAEALKLDVGAVFQPFHGLAFNPREQHAEQFTVVGILAPTGTPVDRVLWIPLAGVQTMAGHDPRAATDVSAVLVKLRTPAVGFMMDLLYNKQGNRLTLAWPIDAILVEFFSKVAWLDRVLALVAALVALVAAGAVLASIYNSMHARRRDLAILRALGARRRTVFGAVLAEAATIGVLGGVLGWIVYAGLIGGAAAIIRAQTGVVLEVWTFQPVLLWAPGAMIGLAALGGIIPAVKAYQVPVVETLAPES